MILVAANARGKSIIKIINKGLDLVENRFDTPKQYAQMIARQAWQEYDILVHKKHFPNVP